MEFTDYDTRLACYAVIVQDDRMLLSWFRGGERSPVGWSLPGGGADWGESAEDTVRREVREETGLEVEVGDPVATQVESDPDHGWVEGRAGRAVKILFAARVTGGVLGTVEVDGSTERAEWLPLAEAARAPNPVVRLGLDTWRRLADVHWV